MSLDFTVDLYTVTLLVLLVQLYNLLLSHFRQLYLTLSHLMDYGAQDETHVLEV